MKIILLLVFVLNLYAQDRIIALAPAISEIVYALGKGDELVGVSEYSAYPPAVKKITKIGGYSNPSLEKIFSLSPTIVIGQTHYSKTLRQLNKLGIKTLSLELDTIKNIKKSISKIADILHVDSKPLIQEINKSIKNITKSKKSKKVLIVYGLSLDINRGIYVAGHNIYFEDIIHLCGAKNAYYQKQLSQPVLHYEGLIDTNPDMVILLHHSNTDGEVNYQKAKELWYSIPINAGKSKEVYILNKDYLSIPSHRVSKSITDICEIINK